MTTPEDGAIKVVPVRHYWQWVGVAIALVLVAMLVNTLFSKVPSGQYVCHSVSGVRRCHQTSEWRFSWNIVFHYFTTSEVLQRSLADRLFDGGGDVRRNRALGWR